MGRGGKWGWGKVGEEGGGRGEKGERKRAREGVGGMTGLECEGETYSACWDSGGGGSALALSVGDGGEGREAEDGEELHLSGVGDGEL